MPTSGLRTQPARPRPTKSEAETVAARLRGLQAVTMSLIRAVDARSVAETVLAEGVPALGGRTGSILLVADDGKTVELVHEIGYGDRVKSRWRSFPLSAPLPARPGGLLGASADIELHDVDVDLATGEALVCFTDGIVERHRGREFFDESGIAKVLRHAAGSDAATLAARIEQEARNLLADEPHDDMAVLVAGCPPHDRRVSSQGIPVHARERRGGTSVRRVDSG